MKSASYSLLTLRPDPERIDVLCVGVVVLDGETVWHVNAPSANDKLKHYGTPANVLARMSVNLKTVLQNCLSLSAARTQLIAMRSSLALHDFEGVFAYCDNQDFALQLAEILKESVFPIIAQPIIEREAEFHITRPLTRARLRKQFEAMGIYAGKTEGIEDHKVVRNFPVSARHGLKAEFALKNSQMHITETVDFDVNESSVRNKTFEAHAKCLVLKAALDIFGKTTRRHIVVSGAGAPHAARTIDLLSTVGDIYSTENASDMDAYIQIMAKAAGNPVMSATH